MAALIGRQKRLTNTNGGRSVPYMGEKGINMINFNKYQAAQLVLALVCFVIGYQNGKSVERKNVDKAQAQVAKIKTEQQQRETVLAQAHAVALQKANAALLEQQNKTADISKQLAAVNAASKNKADKLKSEVLKNETVNNNCAGLNADSLRIYNAAFGY